MGASCSNTGHYHPARYTCPSCYQDLLGIEEGDHTCPNCGAKLRCSIDYVPSFTAEVISDDEHDKVM